jgi:hypothetical protein
VCRESAMRSATRYGNPKIAKILFKMGTSFKREDYLLAVRSGSSKLLKFVLDNGTAPREDLMSIAITRKSPQDIIEVLVNAGWYEAVKHCKMAIKSKNYCALQFMCKGATVGDLNEILSFAIDLKDEMSVSILLGAGVNNERNAGF